MSSGLGIDALLQLVPGYTFPGAVKRQVEESLASFPAMLPSSGEETHGGSTQMLLRLEGTLPIVFRGNQYHIPLVVSLPLDFPQRPPLPRLAPTTDMQVRHSHPHAAPDGTVHLPALAQWDPAASLHSLLAAMAELFGQDPPLYRRSPVGSGPRGALHARVLEALRHETAKRKATVNQLFKVQSAVAERSAVIQGGLAAVHIERDRLREEVKDLTKYNRRMDTWIEALQRVDETTLVPLQLVQGNGMWSAQVIDAVAEDHALEDTLYLLDMALQEGILQLDEFLKMVRKCARAQYFARALAMKVAALQQRTH